MDCVFCAIVEGKASAWRVYEDEDCMAFLDINPATPGHTLVVPRPSSRRRDARTAGPWRTR